jgi:hypothetical protein
MGARRTPWQKALSGLVDYAGLFPPAGLDMLRVLEEYAGYSRGPRSWMLGRLVVAGPRLEELAAALSAGPPERFGITAWPLTVVLGPEPEADVERIARLRAGALGALVRPHAVEGLAQSADAVHRLRALVPRDLDVYVEIPRTADVSAVATAVRQAGALAKIRTGGVRLGDVPAPEPVLQFISACAALGLPFKATAGLHHPVRRVAPLTYEAGSACDTMYGFLNVLFAAAALWHGQGQEAARQLLLADSAETLRARPYGLEWLGHAFAAPDLVTVRQRFFHSVGSCSFTEPVEELEACGADLAGAGAAP